jgi:hypothetical protein
LLPDLGNVAPAKAVEEYERWLAGTASDDAYLYTDLRVRFDARDDDVLVQAPDLARISPVMGFIAMTAPD